VRWLASGALVTGARIAVPGCGSGHDVLALARAGCEVTAIDHAQAAVAMTREHLAGVGARADVVQADVLAGQPEVPLDAVCEQTCWCALHPDRWQACALQWQRWPRPGGRRRLLAMQCLRPGAAEGRVDGPPCHMAHGHQRGARAAVRHAMVMARTARRPGGASDGLGRVGARADTAVSASAPAQRSSDRQRDHAGRDARRAGQAQAALTLAEQAPAKQRGEQHRDFAGRRGVHRGRRDRAGDRLSAVQARWR
jgi:hypothetical protein